MVRRILEAPLQIDKEQKELYNLHIDYQIEALSKLSRALRLEHAAEAVEKLARSKFGAEELQGPDAQ